MSNALELTEHYKTIKHWYLRDFLSHTAKSEENTVHGCSKIIGIQQRNLGTIWEKQAAEKAKIIISQRDHIMSTEFLLLPSGRRYNVPKSKPNRYAKSVCKVWSLSFQGTETIRTILIYE